MNFNCPVAETSESIEPNDNNLELNAIAYTISKIGTLTLVNLRSGVPYIFCRGAKVRLIQLLEYLSVASPESGLFSDWSRNKKVLRTEP